MSKLMVASRPSPTIPLGSPVAKATMIDPGELVLATNNVPVVSPPWVTLGLTRVVVSYEMVIFAPATPSNPVPCRENLPLPDEEIVTTCEAKAPVAPHKNKPAQKNKIGNFFTNCIKCLQEQGKAGK